MINKTDKNITDVLSQIKDGVTIMIGGFGTAGQPAELIDGLIKSLDEPNKVYIRVLSHELANEYVSFRIYSQGEWEIRY